jgi:ABC-type polysaccharide/polyol phosphate transport system ATPase subunit
MSSVISVRGLSKSYLLYKSPYDRLLERLPGAAPRHRAVHALADIDFEIEAGTCMGLIGSNGAGKSTLLKILTGTTIPTSGSYRVEGRVASLLELGAGFAKEFTGRENIFMNAAIMGLSRKETQKKFKEIADFSELGDFIHAPIRTYSSGMVVRLGFSVAVAIDPDVLILDEVFAVGDMHFRQKCADRIWRYKEQGKTLFFCSHSLYDVRQLCENTIWLKQGRIAQIGDSVTVTNEYATYENQLTEQGQDSLEGMPQIETEPTPEDRKKEALPYIVSCRLVDPRTGDLRHEFQPGDDVALRVHLRNGRKRVPLSVAVGFSRRDGHLLCAHTTQLDGVSIDFDEGTVTLLLPNIQLLSGEFTVPTWLLDGRGVHRYHERPAEQNLIVKNRTKELGLVRHEHEWIVEPIAAPARREPGS